MEIIVAYSKVFSTLLGVIVLSLLKKGMEISERYLSVSWNKKIYFFSLIFSVVGILYVTIISRNVQEVRFSYIPFGSYYELLIRDNGFIDCVRQIIIGERHAWLHMFGTINDLCYELLNIILFVPFGFCLRKCSNQNMIILVLVGLALSVVIETVQGMLCLGWVDIDDVFNNTLGTAIGICVEVNRNNNGKKCE